MSPPPRTVPRLGLVAAAAALVAASAAPAQEPASPGLRLGDAVHAALAGNPDLRIARLDMEGARAAVMRADAAFDTRLQTSVSDARRETGSLDENGALAPDVLSSRTSTFDLQLSRELPGGVQMRPSVSVTRTDDPRSLSMPFAQTGASLEMVVPLGPNRAGWLTRSGVREAELGRLRTTHEIRQAASSSVRDVVGAYWEYRATHQRLAVLALAEARAARLLTETRTLVAAEERPAADLIQLEANLASKRMTRLNTEQQLDAVRQRLGLLMGLRASEAARLPDPDEPFPAPVPFRESGEALERLVATAVEHRSEVAVSEARIGVARLQHDIARANARPGIDLSVAVGYTGITTAPGIGGTLAPFYRDVPGMNVSLQLSYQMALSDGAAAGRRVQSAAGLDQQRLAREALGEQVASGVAVAASALERSLLLLGHAAEAVRLFSQAVENEKAKHALDTATLFDVILAEDNLTSALLSEVDAELSHATALARLRWETGTLLESDGAALRFAPEMATTRP